MAIQHHDARGICGALCANKSGVIIKGPKDLLGKNISELDERQLREIARWTLDIKACGPLSKDAEDDLNAFLEKVDVEGYDD